MNILLYLRNLDIIMYTRIMSNFIQSIQINNLNKKVNALATEVSNIIVGGAPVISGDIDMNNNSISEIDQLIFNSGRALIDENGTLNFNNENIIGESQLANYQAKVSSDNLDMNNFSLFNVNGFQVVDNTNGGTTKDFTLINGGLVSNNGSDVRLYLYVNESLEFPTNLDFHLYPLRNVGSIEFQNGGTLTSTDNSSVLFNGNELAAYTMTNDFNGVNQYALRQIANLTLTSGGGLLFGGVQNKLVPDADDDSTLLYQNIPIITASNISDYFPAPVFVPEATSSLNMGNYNITNTNGLVSQYVGF
jgi:hypothetical protein